MISKRTLEKWRKEALTVLSDNGYLSGIVTDDITKQILFKNDQLQQRILDLTRELLDQQLLKTKEKNNGH
jgi:hypothetical protein